MTPRASSAVLLTRGRGAELEVLLIRRAATMGFFGGYWALPGGKVEPEDHDDAFAPAAGVDAAHRVCALRELFEELGVPPPGRLAAFADGADTLRGELERPQGRARFTSAIAAEPAATTALVELTCLTTPPFSLHRFRTRFYLLADVEAESVRPDGTEIAEARFVRPADALADWRRGELAIVPPVLYLLEHFARGTVDEAVRVLRAEAELHGGDFAHDVLAAPGVTILPLATPTLPPATTTNCCLVGGERFVIIDPPTTDPSERERLFAVLDARRDAGQTPLAVLLTHHHHDHVGSAEAVARRYGLPLRAHRETLVRLAFERGTRGLALVPLDDGEELELGTAPDGSPNWRLRAHWTPGHAPGHLVFLDSRYRTLVAGDLVSTLSTIVIDPPEGHMATYLASLERVRALGIGVLCPAHGMAAREGTRVLERTLVHRREREEKLASCLGPVPRTTEELLHDVYDDVDARLHPVARRSLLAGLLKLEEEGRARRIPDRAGAQAWGCA